MGVTEVRAVGTGEHVRERVSPDPDRLLAAMLYGCAKHHARWRDLTADEHAAALTDLQALAGGRADGSAVLAEQAGILIGASEGTLDEPFDRLAAGLLIAAGPDEDLIPQWIEEGRRPTGALPA